MKTRILTSTSHSSVIYQLITSNDTTTHLIGMDLDNAVSTYSRKSSSDGVFTKVEVVDGLRVLGAPIGSPTFCATFLADALLKASADSKKILAGLGNV